MTILLKKFFRPVIAVVTLGTLLTFSACANDNQKASYGTRSTAPTTKSSMSRKSSQTSSREVSHLGKTHRSRKKPIDWQSIVQDPIQYLLTASAFPKPYIPRILTLSERGQAIQDVGRAGISVTNIPSSCNGAGGRISEADDQLAMQMAARGNKSLTLVVVNTDDPHESVTQWKAKNDECSAFLSTENGVTSRVGIIPLDVDSDQSEDVIAYKIVTTTVNIRGSMRQEQILYVVPRKNVIIEVMAMSFNQEVNAEEAKQLLDRALERAEKLERHKLPAHQLIKDVPHK